MIKKALFISILFYMFSVNAFAGEEYTTWKCLTYPKPLSSSADEYALIQFNKQKAIVNKYIELPFYKGFYLLKMHYKYLGNSKNNPTVAIYLYPDNTAILAIDTVRHLASDTGIIEMSSDINVTHQIVHGKKFKLPFSNKVGSSGVGYYCNINQNTKLPETKEIATDHFENN